MRLVSAEALKIVRRRGTMIWCAILTVGSVVVADIVLVALHAANASKHGPAGGFENIRHVVLLMSGLGNVAAILIGSAAGSQDYSSGVLRDLVVTGRPRKTLFRVRYPGALIVFLPLLAIAFGLTTLGAFVFAVDPSGQSDKVAAATAPSTPAKASASSGVSPLIAVLIGIVGLLVGAGVTYLGTRPRSNTPQ